MGTQLSEVDEENLNERIEKFLAEIDNMEEDNLVNPEIKTVKYKYLPQIRKDRLTSHFNLYKGGKHKDQFKKQAQKHSEGEYTVVLESEEPSSHKIGFPKLIDPYPGDRVIRLTPDLKNENMSSKGLNEKSINNPKIPNKTKLSESGEVPISLSKDMKLPAQTSIEDKKQFSKKLRTKSSEGRVMNNNTNKNAAKATDFPKKSMPSLELKRTNIWASPMPSRRKSRVARDGCQKCYKQSFNWKLSQINEIEEKLRQHPLALYPHLEEYIPHNIFEEVTEILDPEMKKALDEDNFVDPERLDDFSEAFRFVPTAYGLEEEEEEVNKIDEDTDSSTAKELLYKLQKGIPMEKVNPYRGIFVYDEREKKASLINRYSRTKFTELESKEKEYTVTKEFCEYLASLSQEEMRTITENDVHAFFASGIDTKPPLSVPIEFIAMEGIPLELRRLTGGPDAIELLKERAGDCAVSTVQSGQKPQSRKKTATMPEKTKFRFGAWYLDPNDWKKIPYDQPLADPKHSAINILETNIRDLDLDNELATMHGTKLFLEFASKNKKRKPEFLKNVVRIMSENKVIEEKSSKEYSME